MSKYSATIVADLGFGDAGKGTIIDFLARKSTTPTVVRFNGGAQAAHNVITPDGRHHTFSQFGSGTLVPGVRTHISRFALLDPIALVEEMQRLQRLDQFDLFTRLSVDRDALVVTPFHKAANRIRERLRGRDNHGTCGMGIGETMADSISADDSVYARDLQDEQTLAQQFIRIQERKRAELLKFAASVQEVDLFEEWKTLEDTTFAKVIAENVARFARRLQIVNGSVLLSRAEKGDLLFEGAQGTLLDEWYGFHPHTTWSTTTFANAETLISEIGFEGEVTKLGVLRAYYTRHGAGPFPTYDSNLTQHFPDLHNGSEGWQGEFRVGWFDFVMARYALSVCGGVDALAITHLDRFQEIPYPKVCVGYDTFQGEIVRNLQVKSVQTDLAYQEGLTQLISSIEPVYERAPSDSSQYLTMISDQLGVPIRIASYGPAAGDKRVL